MFGRKWNPQKAAPILTVVRCSQPLNLGLLVHASMQSESFKSTLPKPKSNPLEPAEPFLCLGEFGFDVRSEY